MDDLFPCVSQLLFDYHLSYSSLYILTFLVTNITYTYTFYICLKQFLSSRPNRQLHDLHLPCEE